MGFTRGMMRSRGDSWVYMLDTSVAWSSSCWPLVWTLCCYEIWDIRGSVLCFHFAKSRLHESIVVYTSRASNSGWGRGASWRWHPFHPNTTALEIPTDARIEARVRRWFFSSHQICPSVSVFFNYKIRMSIKRSQKFPKFGNFWAKIRVS